jgi:chemotaxis protein CheX
METTQSQPVINPKLIVPFVDSVRSVFSTMVGVATTVLRPHIKSTPAPCYDVSSIIGFSGSVVGMVVVSFQKEAAEKLASVFAGESIDASSPDFADALGELANMIAGSAKKHLGSDANITVPSVVIGPAHSLPRLSNVPCVVIPCKTPVGDFAVEVSIKQINAADAQ